MGEARERRASLAKKALQQLAIFRHAARRHRNSVILHCLRKSIRRLEQRRWRRWSAGRKIGGERRSGRESQRDSGGQIKPFH
jgi:hypothetical protein